MKTMTLDEVKKLPPLTKKEIDAAMNFKNTDFSDCAVMTKDELKEFKPWYEVHPEWIKMKKVDVHTKIDMDLLDALKKGGKGYQQRLNETLRWAMENNCPYMTVLIDEQTTR